MVPPACGLHSSLLHVLPLYLDLHHQPCGLCLGLHFLVVFPRTVSTWLNQSCGLRLSLHLLCGPYGLHLALLVVSTWVSFTVNEWSESRLWAKPIQVLTQHHDNNELLEVQNPH